MEPTDSDRSPGAGLPQEDTGALRVLEFVALFIALPLGLAWAKLIGGYRVPVIPTLIGVAGLTLVIAWRDPGIRWRETFVRRGSLEQLRALSLRFAVCAAALTAVVAIATPDELFRFPRERPGLWALVVLLYPLLSVLPQEFLYRVFFFHRYRALLGRALDSASAVPIASALLFGLAHLVFGNWIAVALTTIGGWFFARTYADTRSVWLASLEHSLYGQLVFTVGLGQYFYGGTIQTLGGS